MPPARYCSIVPDTACTIEQERDFVAAIGRRSVTGQNTVASGITGNNACERSSADGVKAAVDLCNASQVRNCRGTRLKEYHKRLQQRLIVPYPARKRVVSP